VFYLFCSQNDEISWYKDRFPTRTYVRADPRYGLRLALYPSEEPLSWASQVSLGRGRGRTDVPGSVQARQLYFSRINLPCIPLSYDLAGTVAVHSEYDGYLAVAGDHLKEDHSGNSVVQGSKDPRPS